MGQMMDDCLQRNNNNRVMWAGADLTLTVYTTSFLDYLTHIPCSSGGPMSGVLKEPTLLSIGFPTLSPQVHKKAN
jgi:hypothetical protein